MIVNINENDGPIAKIIKEKFNKCNGISQMKMLKGRDLKIWATNDGVYNDGYTTLICKWYEFDLICKKLEELGGNMYKYDSAAQKGEKLGSKELPLDSMEGFIAYEFFNSKIGYSITRRSTYYAAILSWAGIVNNIRASRGKKSYINFK